MYIGACIGSIAIGVIDLLYTDQQQLLKRPASICHHLMRDHQAPSKKVWSEKLNLNGPGQWLMLYSNGGLAEIQPVQSIVRASIEHLWKPIN